MTFDEHGSCDDLLSVLAQVRLTAAASKDDKTALLEAIDLFRRVLVLRTDSHPKHIQALTSLADVLSTYFESSGNQDALAESIALYRRALSRVSTFTFHHTKLLDRLANSLKLGADSFGNRDFLAEAIDLHRRALALCNDEDLTRGEISVNLADELRRQFQYSGREELLTEALDLARSALALGPLSTDNRAKALNTLGAILYRRNENSGDRMSLDEIIEVFNEALELRPPGHPNRSSSLNNLATTLKLRFDTVGGMDALRRIMELHREALALRPEGHPLRRSSLMNLANALDTFSRHEQDVDATSEAILCHREAVSLYPVGHAEYGGALLNLANALELRFHQAGDIAFLKEATELYRKALDVQTTGHPIRHRSLNGLAKALTILHEKIKDQGMLNEAINTQRQSLAMRPVGHPNHGETLNCLAISLIKDYECYGHTKSLDEAISLHRQAISAHPVGHPERGNSLNNLASALRASFRQSRDAEVIKEGISCCQDVMGIYLDAHPAKIRSRFIMSQLLLENTEYFAWSDAMAHINQAGSDSSSFPRQRLRFILDTMPVIEEALERDDVASNERLEDALGVYVGAIQLLPRAAHFGLDPTSRLRELFGTETLCRTASLRAVQLNKPELALEIMEEGKAVFWAQALHLRSSALDDLPEEERDDLARSLRLLEHGGRRDTASGEDETAIERWLTERHHLNNRVERMIDNIRIRPGFDRFLKTPSFSQLAQAAASGPIVILFTSKTECLANIILDSSGTSRFLRLRMITPKSLQALALQVPASGLRSRNAEVAFPVVPCSSHQERLTIKTGYTSSVGLSTSNTVLAKIWHTIMEPVLQGIGGKKSSGRNRPRLYLWPVGDFAFLPLHAAGVYKGAHSSNNAACVSDYVVTSYIPSLSALIRSQRSFTPIPRSQLKAMVIAEGHSPGLTSLQKVDEEARAVEELFCTAKASVVNDSANSPTPCSVLSQLPQVHVLHLACHGRQESDPLKSHFALSTGRLSIAKIMTLELRNAFFAFLSACETAKGDREQPDQSVHLAASMLFCGFRSIVATLWTMDDTDGPNVARRLYKELLKKEFIGLDDIPYALDDAVQALRREGVCPSRWATFIHMGA